MSKEQSIVPADIVLPAQLVLLPLNEKPIFPGVLIPLMVQNRFAIETIKKSLELDGFIGLTLSVPERLDHLPEPDELYEVGTAAKIVKKLNLPDGGFNVFISTFQRFRIKKFLQKHPPYVAAVSYLEDRFDPMISEKEITALTRSLVSEMKKVSEKNAFIMEEVKLNIANIDNPIKMVDFISSILNIDREQQQALLATLDVKRRMEQVLIHIKREQELLRLQQKIQRQLNEKVDKSQREYFLREELKAIKQELGMPTDAKQTEYLRFQEAIEQLDIATEIREQIDQELEKFGLMEPNSPEFGIIRNYLEIVVNLPWGDPKPLDVDMRKAQRILDADHYGLGDVKQRIIEFLAVSKLKQDIRGSIICLVGPPGVGKTSVGRSIARALKKRFFRFSVGGMRDEAEIKGHRRTYVGAMPGKIIQGLKIVKSKDPVFMIDEIDKMGVSFQGDPSSALLEVLDPEQNIEFRDHYLDLPFDISGILFIVTANTLDTIPRPLLDRMEVIRLSGYIDEEKIAIAKKYLVPRSTERAGLQKKDVKYTKKALLAIANGYAREVGVRNFEKALDKIHRKLARTVVVDAETPPFSIDVDRIEEFLGKPYFHDEHRRRHMRPGMAIGLAWTPFGGVTMIVEAISNAGKGGFRLTGQMGDVMQESARIAYSYVRSVAPRFKVDTEMFEKYHIHLHIPSGATPKDGPSAGITMASCLLSLVTGRKLPPRIAMTGELSLVGEVLPIGGLKEKVIAARRAGVKQIVIPEQNRRDLSEIPDYIKRGLAFHPVEQMDQVLDILWEGAANR